MLSLATDEITALEIAIDGGADYLEQDGRFVRYTAGSDDSEWYCTRCGSVADICDRTCECDDADDD